MMLEGGRDWYPPEARRRTLTGRVVVEFRIDAAGKPEDVKISRAEADRILQIAAVYMVTTFRFDTKDPLLDPTDSRPYLISISYQLVGCNTPPVPSYPGFEADRAAMVITGSCISGGGYRY
jgi:TonB family protein